MKIDIDSLLEPIVDLAQTAGERIMQVYRSEFAVAHKDDRSPLTEADTAAHDIIVAGLNALTPNVPVLSEEDALVPFAKRSVWPWFWLVDPLDGTREFVKRNGEFTVNIALIKGHQAVLGVIHVPVSEVSFMASQGQGAFRQERHGQPTPIKVRPWDGGRIAIAGSRSHNDGKFDAFLAQFDDVELVNIGSSLKSCLVAEGKVDVYARFGPTSEWDTAAAQCIVEEAGGSFTDMQLQPLRYNAKDSILNPNFLVFGDKSQDWQRYLPQ